MKIIRAAIRYKDKIFTGFDHGECFKKIEKENITDTENLEQGFITDKNEFVDRNTALDIAYKAGQITYEKWNHCLISEDLHLYWLNEQNKELERFKTMWKKLKKFILQERKTIINRNEFMQGMDAAYYEIGDKIQELEEETNETK